MMMQIKKSSSQRKDPEQFGVNPTNMNAIAHQNCQFTACFFTTS